MKIKTLSSPTLQPIHDHESGRLIYRCTVDVELYDDGDRYQERKLDSFPEKPFTYLNCLWWEALNEEYVQTIQPPLPTPEEREQRYQALLQEINEQLMIRWNQGGFLQSMIDEDE